MATSGEGLFGRARQAGDSYSAAQENELKDLDSMDDWSKNAFNYYNANK